MPQELTLEKKVDTYRSGWTIIAYLAHRFPYHTAARWAQRVNEGRVQVNGARIEPAHVVLAEDVVAYTFFHDEPDVDRRFDIVFEDDDLLVVSQSGNLPVHACGVYIRNTLIAELRRRFGDSVSLAHRLDRETSGIVVLTKNKPAARSMAAQFADGSVAKGYIAVAHGRIESPVFEVNAPIGKTDYAVTLTHEQLTMAGVESELKGDLPSAVPKRQVDFKNGKPAITRFTVRGHAGDCTLLDAVPLSGRTNQIRVHLHHVGHPIVGDKVYRPSVVSESLAKLDRHALHCRTLAFEHPKSGERLCLEAPLAEDLRGWLSASR